MTRFELANSRIMDTNMDIIDKVIIEACNNVSHDGKNIHFAKLRSILRDSK